MIPPQIILHVGVISRGFFSHMWWALASTYLVDYALGLATTMPMKTHPDNALYINGSLVAVD